MLRRITIMIDDDLLKRLRNIQSQKIRKSSESISLSKVINQELEKKLKK